MTGVIALALLACQDKPPAPDSAVAPDSAATDTAIDADGPHGDPRYCGCCSYYQQCFRDYDGDTFGHPTDYTYLCGGCYGGWVYNNLDCNESSPAINPSRPEVCDPSNTDENCNKVADDADGSTTNKTTYWRDADADGFGNPSVTTSSCEGVPAGYTTNAADCNDGTSLVSPSRPEICDPSNVDENCNKVADDADSGASGKTTYFWDGDGDKYGTATKTTSSCESAPGGYVSDSKDCNDGTALINPGATEVIGDDVDQTCDGREICYVDADDDDYGTTTTTSSDANCNGSGEGHKAGDCNDNAKSVNPGAPEVCDANNTDEDCDTKADDADTSASGKVPYYTDADGDKFGVGVASSRCDASGTFSATAAGDCDDTRNVTYPGALEVCDDLDNDCDSVVDDGVVVTTFYRDQDGDGYGVSTDTATDCKAPVGYVSQTGDCKDANAAIYPGRPEACDSVDQDCDGQVDEGLPTQVWYRDQDVDGFGDVASTLVVCNTSAPSGYVGNDDDCLPTNAGAYPGGTETPYDGVDQDCSGADFVDVDGDGYDGDTVGGPDCDDSDPAIKPGVTETEDGVDEDCDGKIDDGTALFDDDGDGVSEIDGDCDDAQKDIYPNAPEDCDERDQDCDGWIDDQSPCYDDDGDAWSELNGDCDDDNAQISPDVPESFNGLDDDCDGKVDEGFVEDPDQDGVTATDGDCAPNDPTVYPGALETGDGVDNDCDEIVDEGTQNYDDDEDGFSESKGDCDDEDPGRAPFTVETCDGVDQDCDGLVDDGLDCTPDTDTGGDTDTTGETDPGPDDSDTTGDPNPGVEPPAAIVCGCASSGSPLLGAWVAIALLFARRRR